ncbi:MAG TPA: 3-phosphoshikimate 1-carboxyvinyltransferase [Ktedonobacterales bacterium]|nr:3-phosphoshikimate 1-carboxyvinyltransferase [Ktedonobacterales bacterium]
MTHQDESVVGPGERIPLRLFVRGQSAPRAASVSLRLPGAKYYTLRYLLAALLAVGVSRVRNPARSDDTDVLMRALRALGANIAEESDEDDWILRIMGTGGHLSSPLGNTLNVGNAGAVLRLLLGIGALLPEMTFVTDHPQSLGRRPNADLLVALSQLGLRVEANGPDGLLPITLRGGPPAGGAVTVSGARSSQYLSALLYLAPLLSQGLRITVTDGLRSADLVRATLRALAESGIRVEAAADLRTFTVAGGQHYRPRDVTVPGDVPSAAALAVAALLLGQPARLAALDGSQRETVALLAAFAAFGAPVTLADGVMSIAAELPLRGARLDGDPLIDSVPVLVAAACFAEGESRFENAAHLRLKESDRIGDLCAELRRAGCDVQPLDDGILVRGQPAGIEGGVTVDAHDDHRLAQALALVALRCRTGLTITGADAIAKSYPTFFADLQRLGAEVRDTMSA